MEGLSLRPTQIKTPYNLPDSKTLRAIGVLVLLVVLGVGALLFAGGKRDAAQLKLDEANAAKEAVDLQAKKLQAQLRALEGAGGADRLKLIQQLLDARQDWKRVIIAIGNSAPVSVTLGATAFSGGGAAVPGAVPVDPAALAPDPSVGGGNKVSLSGRAGSKNDVRGFISNLRQHKDVITAVDLRSAASDDSGTAFSLELTLKAPEPPPAAPAPAAAPAPEGEVAPPPAEGG